MYHLYEMPRSRRPGVQITVLGCASDFLAPGCARNVAHPRSQSLENRFKTLKNLLTGANHQAVAALQSPHAAARPRIHIVNSPLGKLCGTPDVVFIEAVSPVDNH